MSSDIEMLRRGHSADRHRVDPYGMTIVLVGYVPTCLCQGGCGGGAWRGQVLPYGAARVPSFLSAPGGQPHAQRHSGFAERVIRIDGIEEREREGDQHHVLDGQRPPPAAVALAQMDLSLIHISEPTRPY